MIENDYDTEVYSNLIRTALITFFNDYTVGTNYRISDVLTFIKSSYEDVVINVIPNSYSDITLQKNQLIRAGNIEVTCVNQKDWGYGL